MVPHICLLYIRRICGKFAGTSVSDVEMAFLKSVALRPSRHVVDSLRPVVEALVEAGYVSDSPSGWMATARGCALIEQERAPDGAHR
jgi:hypothetical protein